ncbi:MAG: alpha/beta fold hydrolase [Candidatus Aminicenantes bacterium]|nr:alpha/beta fold hydrolase [Candidatus Aminicenantes bacterium]
MSRAEQFDLKLWPTRDSHYRGFINKKDRKDYSGTVIVFHGNAGSALDRSYYVKPLARLGYRVVLSEYPGYGAREGYRCEAVISADAIEAVTIAIKEFGGPLYLWGESLGCGIAAHVVKQMGPDLQGVVLLTPWDSLPNLAQSLYRFLPVRLLIKDRFDNVENLREFSRPTAILMAGQDEIIPNRLTKRLFESFNGRKKMWTFPLAGHNSWPAAPDESWWAEVMDFVSR